ncbi:MAG: DUF2089 family protein [Elusimicrobiota bacterium]
MRTCSGIRASVPWDRKTFFYKRRGDFPPDTLSGLSNDEQEFVYAFVLNDGSLKDMARFLGKSYPTVKNMLDGIIHRLKDTRK